MYPELRLVLTTMDYWMVWVAMAEFAGIIIVFFVLFAVAFED